MEDPSLPEFQAPLLKLTFAFPGFPTILSPDLAPTGQNLFLVDASNYGVNFFFLHNLFLPCCFFFLLFCSLVIRFSSHVWCP